MKNYFGIFLCIALITTFSCVNQEEEAPETIDGIWSSVGYGRIAHIEGDTFELADYTDISCLIVLEGSLEEAGYKPFIENDTLKIKDGINEYYYTRLASFPDVCIEEVSAEKQQDPEYNFEVLAKYFEDHYAYFELREVHWETLYSKYRAKVTSETTAPQLFNIMTEMLDTFNDGHISLEASSEVEEEAQKLKIASQNTSEAAEEVSEEELGNFDVAAASAKQFVTQELKESRSKLIKWGITDNNIGFLQVNLMFLHADLNLNDSISGNDYVAAYFGALEDMSSLRHAELEVEGIRSIMEEALDDLSETSSLILDVRFNGGGKDEVALEIMSHFNETSQTVFTKMGRNGDRFTPPNKVELHAAQKPYLKPLYLLTSVESASATEIMVMSSMSLEQVVRMGSNTEGVFSDVLDKQLPNEWIVGLSNEVYIGNDGKNYEGVGIPAHMDLGYTWEGQKFLFEVFNDTEADKQKILQNIMK